MRPFQHRVAGELEPREAADERADRDLALESGQRGAQAVVDPAAEREVVVRVRRA